MEVRNRFKGLDLIDREPDELWIEVDDIVQETGIKTTLTEKKCKQCLLGGEKSIAHMDRHTGGVREPHACSDLNHFYGALLPDFL